MPRPEKYNLTELKAFDSADSLRKSQLETFLGGFSGNLFDTEEGLEALKYVSDNAMSTLNTLDPLFRAGMFGGSDAYCSTAELVEQARRIFLIDKNGDIISYADKFFNNDTVRKMQELEADKEHRKNYSRVLMAHMAMFFSQNSLKLEGGEKLFDGLNPYSTQPDQKVNVLVAPEAGEGMIIADKAVIEAQKKQEQLLEDAKKLQLAIPEEITEPAPEIPDPPKEKSKVRAFFCFFGFPHSPAFKAAAAERNTKLEEKRQYDAKVKDRQQKEEAFKVKAAEYVEAKDHQPEVLKNSQKYIDAVDAAVQAMDMEEMKKAEAQRKALMAKVTRTDVMKKLAQSKVGLLEPGNTQEMVRYASKGYLKANHSKDKVTGTFRAKLDMLFDARETAQIMNSFSQSKNKEEQHRFIDYVNFKFDERIAESEKMFKEVFDMDCTPENVQHVLNVANFQHYVDERVSMDDVALRTNADHKESSALPEVNKHNLGTMTMLLMNTIKTKIYESLPEEQKQVARTKESPESFKSLSDEEGRKQYDKQQKEAGIYTDLTVYESKM